ncbi:MAG: protein kleE [Taibaiella sp.]|nr:protein kleE [Taibaiella sp.]
MEGQVSNILQFPKAPQVPTVNSERATTQSSRLYRIGRGVLRFLWLLLVLSWPLLRLVIIADVTFQMFRMLYYLDTPEINAGWVFLGHFIVLTVLTYLVSAYEQNEILAAKK